MTDTTAPVRAALAIDPEDHVAQEAFVDAQVGPQDAGLVWATADAIHAAHSELRDKRLGGVGRVEWLGSVFRSAGATDDVDVPAFTLLGLPSPGSPEATAQSLLTAARAAEAAGLEAITQTVSDTVMQPSVVARAYFVRPLGDPADVGTVATLAAAVLAPARQQLGADVPVPAVVAAVDLGCSTAKAAYHVATGATPAIEAMEWLEDRAAAVVGGAVRAAVPKLAESAGAWVGGFLGALVGAAPIGQEVGRQLGRVAGPVIAEAIAAGARTIVSAGIRAAKVAARWVNEKITGLGGSIALLFS